MNVLHVIYSVKVVYIFDVKYAIYPRLYSITVNVVVVLVDFDKAELISEI